MQPAVRANFSLRIVIAENFLESAATTAAKTRIDQWHKGYRVFDHALQTSCIASSPYRNALNHSSKKREGVFELFATRWSELMLHGGGPN